MPDAALRAVVTAHSPEARVLRTVRLSGGVSADVYRIDLEAGGSTPRSLVVRVHGPHQNGHPAAVEVDIFRNTPHDSWRYRSPLQVPGILLSGAGSEFRGTGFAERMARS